MGNSTSSKEDKYFGRVTEEDDVAIVGRLRDATGDIIFRGKDTF
jgi:hypothetical protein